MKNRKIYLFKDIYDNIRLRQEHIEDGLENDPLLQGAFTKDFNRNILKSINRFMEFLKTSADEELDSYLLNCKEISSLNDIYNGLKVYRYQEIYDLYFVQNKRRFASDEYKILYLVSANTKLDFENIRQDLDDVHEWKREYVPNETQKRIAGEPGYNIVLGAAGTGKTDVAIHSYLNFLPLDSGLSFSPKEEAFITYSRKLCDYVSYEIDILFDDTKSHVGKNVFTTKDFLINILASANVEIKGYTLYNGSYTKQAQKKLNPSDLLENNIIDLNSFIEWKNNGYKGLNKESTLKLDAIIAKYGIDYPYLFFRGIYKGKIINKVSDNETNTFLGQSYSLNQNQAKALNDLLDDYVNSTDEPSEESFHAWYLTAKKRYSQIFKQLEAISEESRLYEAFNRYYDFASPVREDKKCLDYYPLFLREARLIEGYRGQTRDDFDQEAAILFEASKAFQAYMDLNNLYDDNDLAYFVIQSLDAILERGIYKNIIVDEFQDMTERQIHTLLRLNYNENEHGALHLFGDFEQTINPTFIQLESIETLYMVNGINDYKKQILSSTYRYSDAICKELEALRKKGKELFGSEDLGSYLPLISNKDYAFETNGNLVLDEALGHRMLSKIASAKNLENIMYIVADEKSKAELLEGFKCSPDKVFTVSEAKGRENDFVVVYKLCTSKAQEYERIFSDDFSYSRAGRIFYNQLYVGITRCRTNFLQIEDEAVLGEATSSALKELIAPLASSDVDLFLDEMLSDRVNYYFRALESFKNLDFDAVSDNLAFYSGDDYYSLRDVIKDISQYNINKDEEKLISYANLYKSKRRIDLARIIYIVLDNTNMLHMMDIREHKDIFYSDEEISGIIKSESRMLDNDDIKDIVALGYFDRKKESLENKIKAMKIEVIK